MANAPRSVTFSCSLCRRERLVLFAVLLFPSAAHADVGTPLILAGMFHLVFGNLLIGIVEGLLLSALFKTPRVKSVGLLIVANYTSAWLGGIPLLDYIEYHAHLTIYNFLPWFYASMVIAFGVTLLIEFPFFLLSFGKVQHAVRRAATATFLIHVVSYVALVAWYWMASVTSLVTDLDVVAAEQMGLPQGYSLYYIGQDGTSILRSGLTGGMTEKVASVSLDAHTHSDRLFAQRNDQQQYDLYMLAWDKTEQPKKLLVLANFARLAPIAVKPDGYKAEPNEEMEPWSFDYLGMVPKLGVEGDWDYRRGNWAAEGISGQRINPGDSFRYALETPLCMWRITSATHIEGDFVFFQLGRDQICVLQPQRKQIALVARGSGPLVAKDK